MNNVIFIIVVFIFSFIKINSQNNVDTISFKKNVFRVKGEILKINQVVELTKNNSNACSEIKKAKLSNNLGKGFGFAGGFCIGVPIGQAVGGGQPVWGLLAVGTALIGVGISFDYFFKKHSRKGIRIYNSGINQIGSLNFKVKLGVTSNGIGLLCKF